MNKIITLLLLLFFLYSPALALDYDFSSTRKIPLKMKTTEPISTKMDIQEGQVLKFKMLENVIYKRKLLVKKDTIISARLEMIITSGMNGFPAEIIIDNFEIPNIDKSKLVGTYTKTGQNRSLIVYPIKWALTWLPGVGSLTNLIKGGHAKIKTKDIITIYYYPEWK